MMCLQELALLEAARQGQVNDLERQLRAAREEQAEALQDCKAGWQALKEVERLHKAQMDKAAHQRRVNLQKLGTSLKEARRGERCATKALEGLQKKVRSVGPDAIDLR